MHRPDPMHARSPHVAARLPASAHLARRTLLTSTLPHKLCVISRGGDRDDSRRRPMRMTSFRSIALPAMWCAHGCTGGLAPTATCRCARAAPSLARRALSRAPEQLSHRLSPRHGRHELHGSRTGAVLLSRVANCCLESMSHPPSGCGGPAAARPRVLTHLGGPSGTGPELWYSAEFWCAVARPEVLVAALAHVGLSRGSAAMVGVRRVSSAPLCVGGAGTP